VTGGTGVSFREALGVWTRVGLNSFGGPAGQIAVMHRVLVEEKRWVSESRFLHALNYCMLLPGPEAQQLATYIGWLMHGYAGGLAAGTLFVLPGFFVILALSMLYAGFHGIGVVGALFFGLKAAVLAVVVEALVRIGRRVLHGAAMTVIAALAFIGIFFLRLPFPLIVLGSALAGLVGGRLRPESFAPAEPVAQRGRNEPLLDANLDGRRRAHPSLGRAARVAAVCLVVWALPVAAAALVFGTRHVLVVEALFFSKAAVVTFGGAYAVLAYVAQQAVERYGWLAPGEMLDGLGMAETTPGPLILVLEFVGFMAAYRGAGASRPMLAGVAGAAITVWVTFVPCFLWIFLGAPYVESLRGVRRLDAALRAITAAIVGVILNLAVWFGLHVLFSRIETVHGPMGMRLLVPEWRSLDPAALAIAAGAFAAIFVLRLRMIPTLAAGAAGGILYHLIV
jgi:chromate transporter